MVPRYVFSILSGSFEPFIVLPKYRVAINLYNMSQIITKLVNIISYDSRVLAPECKVRYLHILSIWPNEPDLWPHVLDSEGHNSKKLLGRLIAPMRRTVVVALHSTGYSRLSPFSCLVVDKLLLVLLLSQCKVPPMETSFPWPSCFSRSTRSPTMKDRGRTRLLW
jgi:hypothetical protein